jgi:hypothetical protein
MAASTVAPTPSSPPSTSLIRDRMTEKLPDPVGNVLRADLGGVTARRCRNTSPGARKSKSPYVSAHDRPMTSHAPSAQSPSARARKNH